ncbi:MAG: hypothetical protein ABIF77_11980 [bacterium]
MITLSSFLHREEIRALMTRWFLHDFQPGDPVCIKELVNYNSVCVRRVQDQLAREMLPAVTGSDISSMPVRTKGRYKDLLIQYPERYGCHDLARARTLIRNYQEHPERFYRETPFEGVIYRSLHEDIYVATSRIKRVIRIAEKCSRIITNAITAQIEREAQTANRRPALSTPERPAVPAASEEPDQDALARAEIRILNDVRAGCLNPLDGTLILNDIVGFKLLGGKETVAALLDWVERRDDFVLVEHKVHRGVYSATHLILCWALPRRQLSRLPLEPTIAKVLHCRGMNWDVESGLRQFIRSSESTLNFEVIIQTYEDALESEIGLTMHEERVIRQRSNQDHAMDVARNITVLTKFLFFFALSRRESLAGIPVKLWVRYMPETTDQILFDLTDFPVGEIGLIP